MRVLYFGAEHCPQCRLLRTRVESWCKKHNVEFVFCDTDDDSYSDMLSEYGIRSIPAIVASCEGKEWTIRGIDGWNTFVESYERVKDESKD